MSQFKFAGRGALLKSRQPPIHLLSKHTPVDEDEPPDVPVQAFSAETTSEDLSFVTTFDVADAEDSSRFLRKAFNILQPGYHASKRMPEMEGGYFSHCPRGVPIGQQYSQLCILMQERAQLELLKDCLHRVKSAQIFLEELEGLLQAECRTAYSVRHSLNTEPPNTKLYCLSVLCEDLRLHLAHWNSIKQRLNTNHWLKQKLGHLSFQLQYIMQTLTSLTLKAVYNLDQFIHVGLEVFAHSHVDTASPEMMWSITRGLEDFNVIVNGWKLSYLSSRSQALGKSYLSAVNNSCLATSAHLLLKPLRIIPFTKVLSILASERSKVAAKLTHQFLICNEDFMRMVVTGNVSSCDWGDSSSNEKQSLVKMQKDSPNCRGNTASSTNLSVASLQIGSIRAPDLSELNSPLVQFSQTEQEFAESFLLIVCNSTSLLRKNESHTKNRTPRGNTKVEAKSPLSPVVGRPPRVQFQGDTPVMTRTDSQRKTVSWVDNADNTIRSAVVAHYMDSVWMHMGRNLDLFLDEPAWLNRNGLLMSEMGPVLLLSDSVITVLRNMVDHACCKNSFPGSSVQPLLGVVFRLHALSAFGAWDAVMNASLASEVTDKCQPCHLYGNIYCTRTARLLREMYFPLMSILQEVCHCFPQDTAAAEEIVQHAQADMGVCASLASRILLTCRLAMSWCSSRVQQLLSSWSVHQFLFLTHTDLKLLVDCTKKISSLLDSLHLSEEQFSSRVADTLSVHQVHSLQQQISQVSSHMQNLSGTFMTSFVDKFSERTLSLLQENLLPARHWKRKLSPEAGAEPSQYIVQAVEGLLSPLVPGLSRLSPTSQTEVCSLMVVAFCNTWLSIILKEKIRFSLWGAVQLGIDFEYLRTQLGQMLTDEQVKQGMIHLPIFQQMRAIVSLLKRQPSQKLAGSRLMDNIMCDSQSTVPSLDLVSVDVKMSASTSANVSTVGNGNHKSWKSGAAHIVEEEDIVQVPNMQDWLALRSIGGSKPWKFPACFSRSSSDD